MTDRTKRPNIIPWPPIVLVAAILGGMGLNRIMPWGFSSGLDTATGWAGLALIALALAFDGWAMWTFKRHQTTVSPIHGASALATSGPFAFSRNPIYCGNVMLVVGVGLYTGTWWHMPLAVLTALLIQKLAIEPEEEHLEARFGDAWRAYAAKTRRWL